MNTQLPAPADYLNREGRRQLAVESTQGMGLPPVPYISIEGNRFQVVNERGDAWEPQTYGPIFTQRDPATNQQVGVQGSPQALYIDVILADINANMSKIFYITPYHPNQQTFVPPDCWSDNGVGPSASSRAPQNDQCATCPQNVWGSRINQLGNKVKACDDVKKMAFLIPALNSPATFLLRLKGSSHKNWAGYVEALGKIQIGNRQCDPTDVVTRIYFDPAHVGIMAFHCVSLITPEQAALEDQIWQARSTDTMVGRNDRVRTGALPAPAATAQINPPAPTAPPPQTFVPPPMPAQHQQPAPAFVPPAQPQQPASVQPAPAAPATFVPAQQPLPGQPAPGAAPAAPAAPRRRQRKQAAEAPQQPTGAPPQQPAATAPAAPFAPPAQQTQPAAPAQPTQPAPQNPPQNFGMKPGQPINQDLDNALNAALAPLPPA